jgi:hypothetical protein
MTSREKSTAWLQELTMEYQAGKDGNKELDEDFDNVGKLGKVFLAVDNLQEVNLGEGNNMKPTYISTNLSQEQKEHMFFMLKEFMDCFAWDYIEMPGLSRELVEHVLPIKKGFRPFKQPTRSLNPELLDRIKEEVEQLLKEGFIRTCRYAEWISNIVSVENKNTRKIRVCVDFRSLSKATPKDEYAMPIVELLINRASGIK